jgi:trimeric autotransporter adhesin
MAINVGELVATLTIDDSRFTSDLDRGKKALTDLEDTAKKAGRGVDSSLNDASGGADKLGRSATGARRDLGRVGDAAKDVEKVGQSAKRSADEVGKVGTAAQGAGQKLTGLAGQVSERAGLGAGGSFVGGFTSKLGDLGGKGGPIAASLVGVAAVGLIAGVTLMKAISDGMEREKAQDLIQAKLGISEKAAQDIGRAAGAAYTNGWGESVTANMDAARAAIQSGVLTGEEDTNTFKQTIEQLNIVAELMGEDVPAVARSAGQAIKNGLAKDGAEAFDFLASAQRNSLNVSEDLLDSFDEYSTQMRALGLEGSEGWALVAQGVKNGARDTDVVIDALKEFKLRASDGTAAAAEGFDKLGVSADDFRSAMAKGGTASRDMMATMLRNLHEIKDPQDRYNASLALFGTKFEDIQGAVDTMNLDTAAKQFGDVAGEAKKAGDIMSSNTASSFDSAKRTILASADEIKVGLAGVFGPVLADLATGVSEHKPELMGFFTDLADAGFVTLDAIIGFTSGTLRALAGLTGGSSVALGGMIEGLGTLAGGLAKVMSIIPGMQDDADVFEGVASALDNFREKGIGAADSLRGMADTIDAGRPKLQGMREDVRSAGEAAQNSEILMRALGNTVVTGIPDSKSILISDNSPETVARLEALGLKVETTPNGIRVTAKTDEADTIIGDFINKERTITVNVRAVGMPSGDVVTGAAPAPGVSGQASNPMLPYGGARPQADGSIMAGSFANGKLPDEALIQSPRAHYIQWAEPETGGEAFIPLSVRKRPRSERILQDVADRFGFGLVKMADGGVFDAAAAQGRARSKAGRPYGFGTLDDCSGHLSDVFNAGTGQSVRFTTDSDFASMGWAPGYDPDGFSIGTNGGSGENGHMAGTLFGTNVESDGSSGVQYGGSADGAQDFPMVWHWPGASGGDKPSTEDIQKAVDQALTDELNATGDDKEKLRQRRIDLQRKLDSREGMQSGRTDSGALLSTDGTRVWVTNWPTGLAAEQQDKREPRLTAGLKVFANGGEDHTAQIAGAGAMRLWAEPETGGEAYIPLGANKRPRSLALTKQVANRFGYTLVPMAEGGIGFGSYSGPDTDDPMAPKNWYQGVALASGLGFTALSALGPYLSMAQSKQVDLSNLTPQFDTSANSIPGASEAIGAITDRIDELIAAAKDGKPVNLQVTVDSQSGGVDVEFMRKGL